MPTLKVEVYQSLMDTLVEHCRATGESLDGFVSRALSEALGLDHATLFQVSTGTALVQGVHNKAVTIGDLRRHGDFGLGTFEGLDGEMVALGGRFYQAHPDGSITMPPDSASVPFATLTNFHSQHRSVLTDIDSFEQLVAALDRLRRSQNLFFAVRLEGMLSELHLRVACKVAPGTPLAEAARRQAEFRETDISGTLVGFWSPAYTRMVAIAGWHLHFLSKDSKVGGHLLGCKAKTLDVAVQDIDELHLALPETRQFLQADLNPDPSKALDEAERAKPKF